MSMDLTEVIERIKAGAIDAQENPFLNSVTYGVHKFHRFHTASGHFYLSRPIFVHRASFDGWPKELQNALAEAVHDAVAFQRDSHVKEEAQAVDTIRQAGGEIIELTPEQHRAFADAVAPLHREARSMYDAKLLALAGLGTDR
jgi:TRAP-type C4-dicarboxylate transport system substrate-binding protein